MVCRPCLPLSPAHGFGSLAESLVQKKSLASSPSPRAYFCRAVCLCSPFFDIQHFQTQILHRSSVSHSAVWPHGEFWSAGSRVSLHADWRAPPL